MDVIATGPERLADLLFERRIEIVMGARGDGLGDGGRAALSVVEEEFEIGHTTRPCTGQVNVFRAQRRKDHNLTPGARNGDVQAPLTAITVEWTEVHRDTATGVRAIADREQDDVALVPLH